MNVVLLTAAGTAGPAILFDIFILFTLAVFATYICNRVSIPTLLGFLLTGILAGPSGFGFVKDITSVELMAEIGVILLLFSIGVEYSLQSLFKIKSAVLLGGGLQFLITGLIVYPLALMGNFTAGQSIFLAFLIILSSTAIVLKLLQQRGEIDAAHGRLTLGVLIFQDLIVVPMMLVTPLLAGQGGENPTMELAWLALKAALVVAGALLMARYVVPSILYHLAGTKDREIFLLSIIVLVLAIAWTTQYIGLSLALGAFLAGLVISESEYAHRAMGTLLPFRDVFMAFFFISVGMLFNAHTLINSPLLVLGLALLVFIIKGGAVLLLVVMMGYPARVAIMTAACVAQVGEFSFILAKEGQSYGMLTEEHYQLFLAVSVLSMVAAPFAIMLAPIVIRRIPNNVLAIATEKDGDLDLNGCDLNDHLIIVGYGPTGRYSAQAAKAAGIPYLILELNPETVRRERKNGELIYYGDASQEMVLESAAIERARILLAVTPDQAATRRMVEMAKMLNPSIHLIVRTRYMMEMEPLRKLGAEEVITEELETALEVLARVLRRYLVPESRIETFVSELRADGYKILRENVGNDDGKLAPYLAGFAINRLKVEEFPGLAGKSLRDLDMRNQYGINVLAIQRGGETTMNPNPEAILENDALLLVLGSPSALCDATRRLSTVAPIPNLEI